MDRANRIAPLTLLSLIICSLLASGCITTNAHPQSLRIVCAGSLILPFNQLAERFETNHPETDVTIEGHGSIQAIRQVTDLNREFDLVAVADESLIPVLMYRPMEPGSRNWTQGYTRFGRSEMVLAYTNQSRYSDEINVSNWHEILMRSDVRFGLANPVLDAAGYRALMVLALADQVSARSDILDTVCTDHFNPEVIVNRTIDETHIALPDLLKPMDQKVTVRDGSVFLLSLLKSGGVDYAIEYKCVAEGADLQYLELPEEINLGNPVYQENYDNVTVDLNYQRFSEISLRRVGYPIVYAITIPLNAHNLPGAEAFIDLLRSENVKSIKGMPTQII